MKVRDLVKDTLPSVVWVKAHGKEPLLGHVRPPGDKSISHRALLMAALADGSSTLRGLSKGQDVQATKVAIQALGAVVRSKGDAMIISGGRTKLNVPSAPIDCGNSGTAMRLLAGVVAGLRGTTTLVGDASLSARPMDRIAVPLQKMGAKVGGIGDGTLPPLSICGGSLKGINYEPPQPSAQVKSSILFAGLGADSRTEIVEGVKTRTHTEEMFAMAGASIKVADVGGKWHVELEPSLLSPFELDIPGDPSQAAFWAVAASIVAGSSVSIGPLYTGEQRVGFVEVLRRMGADISWDDRGVLCVQSSTLLGVEVLSTQIPSLDEVPALGIAAAFAKGETIFRNVGELRIKETDRLAGISELLEDFGVRTKVAGDDLVVYGSKSPTKVLPAAVLSHGDHRLAMAGAIGTLGAERGESRLGDFACVATSYPTFLNDLEVLGGSWRKGDSKRATIAIDGPAGSGKSTLALGLADRHHCRRLDTGAMYRAVAWSALENEVSLQDEDALGYLASNAVIFVGEDGISIDGKDVTHAVRTPQVNASVSAVAANAKVRREMVKRQRQWIAENLGGVLEGRDIGTVVVPDAEVKIYLTARGEVRAERRSEEAFEVLARRDRLDSTRATSPLHQAEDAVVIDTTNRSADEVLKEAWQLL